MWPESNMGGTKRIHSLYRAEKRIKPLYRGDNKKRIQPLYSVYKRIQPLHREEKNIQHLCTVQRIRSQAGTLNPFLRKGSKIFQKRIQRWGVVYCM